MKFDNETIIKFKKLWGRYLLQSVLAAAALLVLFVTLGEDRMVLISAIGSTAFVVFALPKTCAARTKIVIGSHLIGLFSGGVFAFISLPPFIEYPLAVGIAFFLMVALDFEHAPAAGTAIATVTYGGSLDIWIAVISSAVLLSLTRHILRNRLINLL
jgi:CBS-domain-containing membrane protein